MTEPPDFDELARRYVTLWEQQLAATATDAALTAQLANAFTAMAQLWPMALQGFTAGLPATTTRDGQDAGQSDARQVAATAAGSAAAAAAPDDGLQQLAELNRRLAAVEKRLAAMEAGAGGGGRGAAKGTRRRKAT